MIRKIASLSLALIMAAGAALPAAAQTSAAAPAVKAPTSVDGCMMMLVMAGNKIQAAKLDATAMKDMKSKGQKMAAQCQSKKFGDALATHQAILKALPAAK